MVTGYLREIFSSRQGEGSYTGESMTFVRLQGCALRCQWCDTPEGLAHRVATARIETPARSAQFRVVTNPITPEQLTPWLTEFSDPWWAITGGEPLEQAAFLVAWLRSQGVEWNASAAPNRHPGPGRRPRLLLETAGIHTKALQRVLPYLTTDDVISMDVKLPSSTGMRAYWLEHEAFLRATVAAAPEVYVKLVVTRSTERAEIERALALVTQIDPEIAVFLQPASATANFAAIPDENQVAAWQRLGQNYGARVAVRPQMHKVWGVL